MAEIFRILHLTDLHFTVNNLIPDNSAFKKLIIPFFYPEQNVANIDNPTRNFETILDLWNEIVEITGPIDHVVLTGDIANFGIEDEYITGLEELQKIQRLIKNRNDQAIESSKNDGSFLDPNIFTIVPGNHDRISEKISKNPRHWFRRAVLWNIIGFVKVNWTILRGYYGRIKSSDEINLELFHRYFGSTIEQAQVAIREKSNRCKKIEYPFYKKFLNGKLAIVGLNTTLKEPIHKTVLNAFGTFPISQQMKLKKLLNDPKKLKKVNYCVLLSHHYPNPIDRSKESRIYLRFLYPERLLDVLNIYANEFLVLCGHIHMYRYSPVFSHTKLGPKIIAGDTSTFRTIDNAEMTIPLYIHEFSETDNSNNGIAHKHIVYNFKIGKRENGAKFEILNTIKQVPKASAERVKIIGIEDIEFEKMKDKYQYEKSEIKLEWKYVLDYLSRMSKMSDSSLPEYDDLKKLTREGQQTLFTEHYEKLLAEIGHSVIVKRKFSNDDRRKLNTIITTLTRVIKASENEQ